MEGGLLGGMVQVINLVRDLVNAGYKAETKWEEFPHKVKLLQTRNGLWTNLESTYGPGSFRELETSIKIARDLLQKEKIKLLQRMDKEEKHKTKLKVGKAIFVAQQAVLPAKIGQAINAVQEAFNNVIEVLKESTELPRLAQERMQQGRPPLEFESDQRYVRLQKMTEEVVEALSIAHVKLTLLHGGPGRGKSSLARDLVLQIRWRAEAERHELISNLSNQAVQSIPSTSSHLPSSDGGSSQLHRVFHEAVYLTCGSEAELKTLQRALLKQLAWLKVEDVSDSNLQTTIVNLLQYKKLLIVLDDVWDAEFLQRMLTLAARAPHVKFLIISQNPHICDGLNANYSYKDVLMEKISLLDARKILEHHILNPDSEHRSSFKDIPDSKHIKECANRIIEKLDRNIFALACVGGAACFDMQDFKNPKAWEEVEKELGHLLCQEYAAKQVQSVRYPHPHYLAAVQFSLSKLKKNATMLLAITSWCREPSVPEDIVKYLFKTSTSRISWKASKEILVSSSLIQVEGKFGDKLMWSLHSLLRGLLEEKFLDEYKEAFSRGLARKNYVFATHEAETQVLSKLCLLYFKDHTFAEDITAKLKAPIPCDWLSHVHDGLMSSAYRDLAALVVRESTTFETQRRQQTARKALLEDQKSQIINLTRLNPNDLGQKYFLWHIHGPLRGTGGGRGRGEGTSLYRECGRGYRVAMSPYEEFKKSVGSEYSFDSTKYFIQSDDDNYYEIEDELRGELRDHALYG